MQEITKDCIPLVHAAGMLPFTKLVALYLKINCTQNVFEIFSRNKDGFSPKMQCNALGESFGLLREKKEVAAEM